MVRTLEDQRSSFEGSFRKQVDTFRADHPQATSGDLHEMFGQGRLQTERSRGKEVCSLLHLSRPLECRMCGEEIDPREDSQHLILQIQHCDVGWMQRTTSNKELVVFMCNCKCRPLLCASTWSSRGAPQRWIRLCAPQSVAT